MLRPGSFAMFPRSFPFPTTRWSMTRAASLGLDKHCTRVACEQWTEKSTEILHNQSQWPRVTDCPHVPCANPISLSFSVAKNAEHLRRLEHRPSMHQDLHPSACRTLPYKLQQHSTRRQFDLSAYIQLRFSTNLSPIPIHTLIKFISTTIKLIHS